MSLWEKTTHSGSWKSIFGSCKHAQMRNITEVKPYCVAKMNGSENGIAFIKPTAVLHPTLGPPRHEVRSGPGKWWEDWTHCLRRQAERAGFVHRGEQKAPEKPSCGLSILKGGFYKRLRYFNRACIDRTKGNDSFELKGGRLRLSIKKKFVMMRVAKHWKRLPREVVDVPPLETFKACQKELWASSFSGRCPWPRQEG